MCDPEKRAADLEKRVFDLEEEVKRLQSVVGECLRWNDLPPYVDTDLILRELDNLRHSSADRNHSHPNQD